MITTTSLYQTQRLHAYLHTAQSGNLHLRVRMASGVDFSDDLRESFRRVGSPATFSPKGAPFTWDYPLTAAAVVTLQRVAAQYNLPIEWSPDLTQFAEEQAKIEAYEKAVRLAIEKAMQNNEALPDYPTRLVMENGEPCPPMRHQRVAFHWALRSTALMLAHEPGLGKTREGCDVVGGWYREGIVRPMEQVWLPPVYDHKTGAIIRGNRWGVKHGVLVICPKGMMRTWKDELTLWQNAMGIEIAGGSRKAKNLKAGTMGHAHICNYESLDVVLGNEYDAIIADECFIAGTPVWTDIGVVPIEKVSPGDRVWSYNHSSRCLELKRVEKAIVGHPKGAMLRVETEHGEFIVTEGHPFYTQRGYVEAKRLVDGDEVLLGVREGFSNPSSGQADGKSVQFCLSRKSNEQSAPSTPRCGKARKAQLSPVREGIPSGEQIQTVSLLQHGVCVQKQRGAVRPVEHGVLLRENAEQQSDGEPGDACEDEGNAPSDQASAQGKGWERQRPNQTRADDAQGTVGVVSRNHYEFHIYDGSRQPLPDALQNRYSDTVEKGGSRDRRPFPLFFGETRAGQEKDGVPSVSRVVRVSLHQQASRGAGGDLGVEHVPVYNLEVAGNHNYFVGTTPHLVHNCHRLANNSGFTQNTMELSQQAKRKLWLSGTPVSNSLESVFYQMLILDGGRSLGASKTAFLEQWFDTETVGPGVSVSKPKQNAVTEVSKLMSRCTYFLKKDECTDLPARLHTPVTVEMDPQQQKYYDELKKETLVYIQDSTVTVEQAASRMMKLRQVTQGFVLDDQKIAKTFNSGKIDALEEMLRGKLAGRKVVVWGVFTHEIDLICRRIQQMNLGYVRFDGTVTSKKVRDENLKLWNTDNRISVFVGQIQMGVGITLHAQKQSDLLSLEPGEMIVPCYDCVYVGIDYSYTNWVQSVDRIHRIGQKYSCNYTYLLTLNGIDRSIYAALQVKKNTAEAVHKTGKEFFRSLLTGDVPSLGAVS